MPTLKKYSDFQSLKADPGPEKETSPQDTAQRNEAWMAFLKALQQAKKTASQNHLGAGKKFCLLNRLLQFKRWKSLLLDWMIWLLKIKTNR